MQSKENTTQIKVVFSPYNNDKIRTLLMAVQDEFGFERSRWRWYALSDETPKNDWHIMFEFHDPADAVLFALKYPLYVSIDR